MTEDLTRLTKAALNLRLSEPHAPAALRRIKKAALLDEVRQQLKPSAPPPADRDAIARRAYVLWRMGGRDPLENWLRAERDLAARA